MYRVSRRNRSPLNPLVGLLIILTAVGAFFAYQQLNHQFSQPGATPTPTSLPAATKAAQPQATATATPLPEERFRIVAQKVNMSTLITEVYFSGDAAGWDLTYLADFAGHLEGTAHLGQGGNFVLAGHVELEGGVPGPFVNIGQLAPGDEIIIYNDRAENPVFVRYKVTEVKEVDPTDISVIRNRGYEELTLITCSDWSQDAGEYLTRIIVHAVPF